jgi:signal transduction histidine kinase
MKSSWFPILLVGLLLGLLCLLAFFQYRWLGQISDGERERLSRTVKSDTERFAEDFNREIQNAYFNFQMTADVWKEQNWKDFNERYEFYKSKTAFPELVKDFYFVKLGEQPQLFRYAGDGGEFLPAEWTAALDKIKPELVSGEGISSINEEIPALLMPVYETPERLDRIVIRTKGAEEIKGITPPELPKKFGYLVIALDRGVIENRIFPELAKKYFSRSESADYKISVTDKNDRTIFQTGEVAAPDATAKLFNLAPEKFTFFANRELLPAAAVTAAKGKGSFIISQVQTKTDSKILLNGREEKIDVQVFSREQTSSDEQPRVRILNSQNLDMNGIWTLSVQHSAGSLEQFIANTRNRNLAVSFGILSLLAVSIILIFISSHRARTFAQRQVDFVSSVSHEFRTPLAVIYSAGENLSDGVIRDDAKITSYGNLIKREGKKLSAMVEQILEFAGARSGKRKYDFQKVEIEKIIEEAVAECRPLIEENDFTLETEIAENLPAVSADRQALTQAVQNLIANAIKYSGGEKFVKISARNGDGKVKIAVEDKGIGIEKKEFGKIFEPFYRSKRVVDAQIHGNGLGLSLVKQIVDAHGGKIFVESESEKGSRFTIELRPENNGSA